MSLNQSSQTSVCIELFLSHHLLCYQAVLDSFVRLCRQPAKKKHKKDMDNRTG